MPTPVARTSGAEDAPAAFPAERTAPPRAEPPARAVARALSFPYLPEPEWIPTAWNHDRGRHGEAVRYIVIHYTAISYERTLRTFHNPSSRVSAHYVVRGDGHIAQILGEADTGWHAGNYWYNQRSVGIEIELDPVTNPEYTVEQYHATAALACAIAARHGIPLDRNHVVGHNEIPNTGKIDPGPTWSWPHFMWLTSLCAPPTLATVHASWVSQTPDLHLAPDEVGDVSVVLRNTGGTAWRKGTPHEARLAIPENDTRLAFLAAGWPTLDRVAAQTEEFVPPGETATFTFRVRGAKPGTFVLPLRGVIDGAAWMPDAGIHTKVVVRPAADVSLP